MGQVCLKERCLAFEQIHTTDRRADWDGQEPPVEIRCRVLDRTFVKFDKTQWDEALARRTGKKRGGA